MQTADNKTRLHEIIEQDKKNKQERLNRVKELMKDFSFMIWIENFANRHPSFRDNDVFDDCTKEDLINLKKLGLLFEGIEIYAKNNYYYSQYDGFNDIEYYRIKFNNIGYEIGKIVNQGIYYFCEKSKDLDNCFIEFSDIIMNNNTKRKEEIKEKLNYLKQYIKLCYEEGIPLEALKETTDGALWDIKDIINQNERIKILKKNSLYH